MRTNGVTWLARVAVRERGAVLAAALAVADAVSASLGGSALSASLGAPALAVAPAWVSDVHAWWAWVVIVGNGAVGAWALAAHRWAQARTPWLWRATAVAELAIFVQVVLGVVLLQGRDAEPYGMHVFYGFVAAFAVAIVYSYRAQLRDRWYLLYGFGGLFLMGLGLRALSLQPA